MSVSISQPGVEILAPVTEAYAEVLTPAAVGFLADLHRTFNARRKQLLVARHDRQQRLDAGERPDFLPDTRHIRESEWSGAPIPDDILDRRVENHRPRRPQNDHQRPQLRRQPRSSWPTSKTPALRSGTTSSTATSICVDAIRREITFVDPSTGKHYKLIDNPAVLFVRPRGWHLEERHMLVDGEPISGSIFDFGLYFYHNARELLSRGSGTYFYLPKMESHIEARLWNDIFIRAQKLREIPRGSIRATVLIETILATFEMDEILHELREHSASLNCGRWDYIFSYIKKFSADPHAVLPDRAQVTMATHFMRSYSRLAIKTCHRRNVHAMGGMSAYIPIKSDPVANEKAIAQVQADKEREAGDGHDGTWVAHPGLVPVALEIFNRLMPEPNQITKQLPDYHPTAADLLQVPEGQITEAGLKQNVAVGLGYVEAWLRGIGCVPLFNLMEDAATAEISRAQLWQWVHHAARLSDGRVIDIALVESLIDAELVRQQSAVDATRFAAYQKAASLMRELVQSPRFVEFLTVPAYEQVLKEETFATD